MASWLSACFQCWVLDPRCRSFFSLLPLRVVVRTSLSQIARYSSLYAASSPGNCQRVLDTLRSW